MRTSLSRSVVAVVALGVASAALATPATAAAPAGVSRDQVAKAIADLRSDLAANGEVTAVSGPQLDALAAKICTYDAGQPVDAVAVSLTPAGRNADGLIVSADVVRGGLITTCTFAALVSNAAYTLEGTYSLTVTDYFDANPVVASDVTASTTDNVFVTSATYTKSDPVELTTGAVLSATGNASRSTIVPTTVKEYTPKTRQQIKTALKQNRKAIASAKKAYAKALKKAGTKSSKKAAAKRAYKARIATARAAYKQAISPYAMVNINRIDTERLSYSISAEI